MMLLPIHSWMNLLFAKFDFHDMLNNLFMVSLTAMQLRLHSAKWQDD
jgi:hypothetical protein